MQKLRDLLKIVARMEMIIFATSCFALKFFGPELFGDPDVMWHLAAGELIIKAGAVPVNDPWSYASYGSQWYNLSWVWDIAISMIYKILGLQGLYNICVIGHSVFLVLLYKALRVSYGIKYEEVALAAAALCGLTLADVMFMRPQLLSYFLMLACALLLEQRKSRSIYMTIMMLMGITVIWVNTHGTFLIIWLIGGIYCLEELLSKNWKEAFILVGIGVSALVASLANPWGVDVYYGTLRTLDTVIRPYISEWKPFTFGANYGSSVVLLCAVIIGFMNEGIKLRYKLLALISLGMALSSIRNWPLATILGAPFFALSLEGVFERFPVKKNDVLERYGQPIFSVVMIGCAIYALCMPQKIDRKRAAIQEIAYVVEHYPGEAIFNEYDLGGAMIFYGGGKIKHFIDGRAGTAFSEEAMNKYVEFITNSYQWDTLFSAYPAEVAIVPKAFMRFVNSRDFFDNWYRVFEGNEAYVYAKNSPISKVVELKE